MTRPLGYSVERRDMFADTPIAIRRPRPPGRGRVELLSEAEARALRDALTAALGEDPRDAVRWRSLWACERIRFVGGASLGTPDALLGADFHRKHPARDDAGSRALLLDFVDGTGLGMAAMAFATKPLEVPDAAVASEGAAKRSTTCPKCRQLLTFDGALCPLCVHEASVASEGADGLGSAPSTPRLCAVCWGDGCERCCQTGVEGTP